MSQFDSYCTFDDLVDIYPNIDEFDSKSPIYGFEGFETNQFPTQDGRELQVSYNTGYIKSLFIDGKDWGEPARIISAIGEDSLKWYYNQADDVLYFFYDGNANDVLVEKGDNWTNLKKKIINKASRYFDSRVDSNISREQFRDKNGEFDYIVVRTTALIACKFLINGYEPDSPIAESFDEEINFNIELINKGEAKLSHQATTDSSSGIVRIIELGSPEKSLNLVDTRGSYTGVFDLIKVICTTPGAIGTAKVDVYTGDKTNGIKSKQSLSDQLVTGLYQSVGFGLEVRFQGAESTTIMRLNDEWEIEVRGLGEELQDLGAGNIRVTKMTRGGSGVYF